MELLRNIVYFENKDFSITENNTKVVPRFAINDDQFLFILIMGNFCGYCTAVKPEIEVLAEELKNSHNIICGCIVVDSSEHIKHEHKTDLNAKLKIITGEMKGVPCFVSYNNKTGWHVAGNINRTAAAFKIYLDEQFAL